MMKTTALVLVFVFETQIGPAPSAVITNAEIHLLATQGLRGLKVFYFFRTTTKRER